MMGVLSAGGRSLTIIESDAHYREVLRRIAALEGLMARLRDVEAEAIAERALGRLTAEDVQEVSEAGPLGDALVNLAYTLGQLTTEASEWEAFVDYGRPAAAGM